MSFAFEAFRRLEKKFKRFRRQTMSRFNDVNDALTRIDAATTEVAKDLTRLRDEIKDGMTPEEAQAVRDRATGLAEKLEKVGQDPEDPIPTDDTVVSDGGDDTVVPDGGDDTVSA